MSRSPVRVSASLAVTFLSSCLVAGALAAEKAPSASKDAPRLSAEQQAAWRAQIRSTLFVPDPLPELDARSHGQFEPTPGVVAERVTYGTQFGMRVPAILYLPQKPAGKIPGLIVINGHGGDKFSWYAFYTGMLYARAGAAVLTYDPIGEGERHSERKSATRAHDKRLAPDAMGRRMGGQMMTDVMQAVSFLRQRPEVDSDRIGAMGYSMGSFILALTGAVDERIGACVLVGGGNLDGAGGVWDSAKPMCQAIPYQSLRFLGDRGAAIYALHATRGPTLIVNGLADVVVGIPQVGEAFFPDLRERAAQLLGSRSGLFEFENVPAVSHRPFFVTASVALWLEAQLDFPAWTADEIHRLPTSHIGRWANDNQVEIYRSYTAQDREGGVQALGAGIPGLRRELLFALSPEEWALQKESLIYDEWVRRARAEPDEPALGAAARQ